MTGPATTQNNLVQGSEFKVKVCTTSDFFANDVTCQDAVAKPPPPTPHLTVLKVAFVRPPGGQFEGGIPGDSFFGGPLARAVAVGGTVSYLISVRNNSAEFAPGISVSDLLPRGCETEAGFPTEGATGLVRSNDEDIPPHGVLVLYVICFNVGHDLDNSVTVRQHSTPLGVASAQHITVGMVHPAPIGHADSSEVEGGISRVEIASLPSFFPVTGVQVAVHRLGVRGCQWLSAKGRFVKRPKGSCGLQVWPALPLGSEGPAVISSSVVDPVFLTETMSLFPPCHHTVTSWAWAAETTISSTTPASTRPRPKHAANLPIAWLCMLRVPIATSDPPMCRCHGERKPKCRVHSATGSGDALIPQLRAGPSLTQRKHLNNHLRPPPRQDESLPPARPA